MTKVVYLFGAGINRGISERNGSVPPLATDLFIQAMKFDRIGGDLYLEKIEPVFRYIQKYWKLNREDLASCPFDLEACYTLLELQLNEAKALGRHNDIIELQDTILKLTILFAETLQQFEHSLLYPSAFNELGKIIYSENADVLTFNYDTLIERSLEYAAGIPENDPPLELQYDSGEISDDEIRYSHFNWNRPLSYGVRFDEVLLHRAGLATYVDGERFYNAHSEGFYNSRVLKLHGSINWFVYSGIKKNQSSGCNVNSHKGKTLLSRSKWWLNEPAEKNGEIIEPLIITPTLYKNYDDNKIITSVWEQAKKSLVDCNRLIIGGYSFPPTDFAVRKLFLEAFERRPPDEIIVINPDTSVVKTIKELSHFKKPIVVCKDLDEFIKLYQN
ncbi:hypothetical protein [Vibrio sp. Vb2424]|uniref:hypothetical protein n=1 Tax=Vibrio sp. Vb2424 TaxID=2816074 RepID=UPI001A905E7A|nr:hypothetical protein [Vibrio sp. Vb2424]MBO0146454.1 hypothetical protein [Vibrio sp. Vb2424]HCE1967469.1 hypothetical protein [Vibrio parahaemolyticus]HCE1970869.1 hypothetical protein [Vibrio parahaemolyticus]